MMLAWLIESSIVAVVALAIVSIRRLSAPLRHALLLIALLKFAVPPIFVIPVDFIVSMSDVVPVNFENSAGMAAVLQIAHAVSVAFVVAILVFRLTRVNALARRSRVVASEDFLAVAREIGMKRVPRLLISDEAVAPMSFGMIRPAVLISQQLVDRLDPAELRVVFAHELVHHRRGDLFVGHVQAWLSALWWFNPLFHLVARGIQQVREEACDDFLLSRRLTTDDQYCSLLLESARSVRSPSLAIAIPSMARHPLDRRIRRIMSPGLPRRHGLSRVARYLLIAAALAAMPGYEVPSHEREMRQQVRDYVKQQIANATRRHN